MQDWPFKFFLDLKMWPQIKQLISDLTDMINIERDIYFLYFNV